MTSVYVSSVIPASTSLVWSVIRDFNGLPDWHPLVTESRIEEGQSASAVGCIRRFTQLGGALIRERLEALDDHHHLQSYSIVQAPLPVTDYRATLQLWPITESDSTFVVWSAQFNCNTSDTANLITDLRKVFGDGLSALKTQLHR